MNTHSALLLVSPHFAKNREDSCFRAHVGSEKLANKALKGCSTGHIDKNLTTHGKLGYNFLSEYNKGA